MLKKKTQKDKEEELYQFIENLNNSELMELYNMYNSENKIYYNDEKSINEFFTSKIKHFFTKEKITCNYYSNVWQAFKSVHYGDYSILDNYFIMDIYLKSFNSVIEGINLPRLVNTLQVNNFSIEKYMKNKKIGEY